MKPIVQSGDQWNMEMLSKLSDIGEKYTNELGFNHFPLQIEIVSPQQMLGLYSSSALPYMYNHWSFGKQYAQEYKEFFSGMKGLAYEICKDTNPCLCFNMETNNAIEQASVIFHVYGHSSHFASNYLYQENSNSDLMLNYIDYARKFIKQCEDKFGLDQVERVLDMAHSLQYHSVNKYKKVKANYEEINLSRELNLVTSRDYVLDRLSPLKHAKPDYGNDDGERDDVSLPEENILLFIEKHSPVLCKWEREVIRIVRILAQFSYPHFSGQSQIMAEGTAMFTECYIMERAHDDGYIDEGSYLEYLSMNSWVLYQMEVNSKTKNPIQSLQNIRMNPYFIGLHIMRDIKRMCLEPTLEDKKFAPDLAGADWKVALRDAISNFKDESFIRQFLSPSLIRKLKLMHVVNNEDGDFEVKSDAEHYNQLRNAFADMNTVIDKIPNVEVWKYDGDNLKLRYTQYRGRDLHRPYVTKVLKYISTLMGCDVQLWYGSNDTPYWLEFNT